MRNNMYIICRESDMNGVLNFYAETGTEQYFLFHQKFRRSTYAFYKNGVSIHRVFDFKTAHGNRDIENVIKRLPAQIAYVEKEYNITILKRTAKRNAA